MSTDDSRRQLEKLVRESKQELDRENAEREEELRKAEEAGAQRAEEAQEQLLKMGLSKSDLGVDDDSADEEREIERISNELAGAAPSSNHFDASRVDALPGGMPPEVQVVTPAFSSMLGSSIQQGQTAANGPASLWRYNTGEHNPWAWAKGAGSGLAGTGVGQFTVNVDFWFGFVPTRSGFHGLRVYTNYRGFYILKSDDSWYDSHRARATLSSRINVYQYNWKGEQAENAFHRSSQNINVNLRYDNNRSQYYSALLAHGDTVWVRNRIRLYVYARGGSAYSKLDFGTGSGNWIRSPYMYVS